MCQGGRVGDMNVLEWGGRSVGFVKGRVEGGGERAESVPE